MAARLRLPPGLSGSKQAAYRVLFPLSSCSYAFCSCDVPARDVRNPSNVFGLLSLLSLSNAAGDEEKDAALPWPPVFVQ
jgi:hypothetical protein